MEKKKIISFILALTLALYCTACDASVPVPDFPQPLARGEPSEAVSLGGDVTDTMKGFNDADDYMTLLSAANNAAGSGVRCYVTGSDGWKETTSNMLIAAAGCQAGYNGAHSPLSMLFNETSAFHLSTEELSLFTSDLIDSEVSAADLGNRIADLVNSSEEPAAAMLWAVPCQFDGTVRFLKYSESQTPSYVDVEHFVGVRDILLAAIGPDSAVLDFAERFDEEMKQIGMSCKSQYFSNCAEAEQQYTFQATPLFTGNTNFCSEDVYYSFNLTKLDPDKLEGTLPDGVMGFQYRKWSTEDTFTLGLYTTDELPDVRAEITQLRSFNKDSGQWEDVPKGTLNLTDPVRLTSLSGSDDESIREELGMISKEPVTYF